MKTILIIDDDAFIREVAQTSLEMMAGWNVHAVGSGAAALERAAEGDIDAVLLDVMMPVMDGRSTLEGLRSSPSTRDLPVIFLTARLREGERRSLEQLDVAGVLAKPFDPERLHVDVARQLGWSLEHG